MEYNYKNVSSVDFVRNVKCHWSVEKVADFLEKRLSHLDFNVDTWSYQRKTALEVLVGDKTRHTSREKQVMCLLLKHGANPLKSRGKETIMQKILRNRDSALIIDFLTNVEDINILHGGKTALHVAVSRGLRDVVEYIMRRGELKINKKSNENHSALHEAAKRGRVDLIKILVENGAEMEVRDGVGQTPLHWALRYHNSIELIKTMVENGANVDSKDKYGNSPLHIFCSKGPGVNLDVFDLLMQKVIDPNIRDNQGCTPIHLLMRLLPVGSETKNKKFVEAFLKYGGNLNTEDGLFGTVLHVAACLNHSSTFLIFLLEKGAYPGIVNGTNQTFMDYIVRSNRAKVKEILKSMVIQEFKGRFELDPLLLHCVKTDREFSEYVQSCRIEICRMNDRQLRSDMTLSLFTVLSSNERNLANIFRDDLTRTGMAKFFRKKFSIFKKKIPIYGSNLLWSYKTGLRRMHSENILQDFLTQVAGNELDVHSFETILRLSSTEEIMKINTKNTFQRSPPMKSLMEKREVDIQYNFQPTLVNSIILYVAVYSIHFFLG